jgi:hypothetical protein
MVSSKSQITEPMESVPLSPVESYFWSFEQDMDGAFRVTVLLRLEGCIEANFLAAALEQLQRRHPKLRAAIALGADGLLRYQFKSLAPPIPLEIIDCYEAETPWRETTRRLQQTNLSANGPLAAVTVLRNRAQGRCEVFLMLPHAIADGMSGIMLMDDLLTEYARAEAGEDRPMSPALPVITAPRAKPTGGWRGRSRLFRRFRSMKREEKRTALTSLPEARDIPPQSQWVHWVFSREETVTLTRFCRKERASLSGALVAAACCGVKDCLQAPDALFKWQLPFNIRELLTGSAGPVTAQDLGCFVSNMNGLLKITDELTFWDVARSAHQELQLFMEQGGPSFSYNTASFLYGLKVNAFRLLKRPLPKMTPASYQRETLLATHYGVLNIRDAYGSLRPKECTLMFKNEITGPSLIMEALVLGQRLNVGFAADDLEPAFWDQLHLAVRARLDGAIRGSSRGNERLTGLPSDQAAAHRISVAPHE